MKITKNLILYRDFENEQLFYDFTWVMENYQNEYYNKEDVEGLFYECLKKLMELAVSHGFSGNLWHNFLAFLLVNNENAYSRACEIRGEVKGSINEVARHDFAIMKELFDFDLSVLGNYFSVDCMDALLHYEETADAGKLFNKRIRDRIAELCHIWRQRRMQKNLNRRSRHFTGNSESENWVCTRHSASDTQMTGHRLFRSPISRM